MKTLGEAANDLPWIAPSVASLTMLAQAPALSAAWTQVRTDPGFVLLSARILQAHSDEDDVALLDAVLRNQPYFHVGFVDWSQPGPDAVHRVCCRQALLANRLADKLGVDGRQAWTACFLAPLGWLGMAAIEPGKSTEYQKLLNENTDTAGWQREAWGLDHTALARRLSRCWRLPSWLTVILGHLGLHSTIASRLGAEPRLFQIVQLAIALVQERDSVALF